MKGQMVMNVILSGIVSFYFHEGLEGRVHSGMASFRLGGLVGDPLVVLEVSFRFVGVVIDDHMLGKGSVADV